MKSYSLCHLADHVLMHDLKSLVLRHRTTTAELLAHIAEVDERRLYLPAAYPSMYLYCVSELHMSEDSALKRIQAARAARSFPGIFAAVAEGRLHLSAVCMLAPHLSAESADELLAAAVHKTKSEIALLLAERFPRPDLPTSVRAVTPASQLVPEPVAAFAMQPAPSMKTVCQASVVLDSSGTFLTVHPLILDCRPSHRGRRSPAVYSGSGFCPRRRCGRAGSHTGQRALSPRGMPGSSAHVSASVAV